MTDSTGAPDSVREEDEAGATDVFIDASKKFVPTFPWGKVWVASESDAIGNWLVEGVTSDVVASAFD